MTSVRCYWYCPTYNVFDQIESKHGRLTATIFVIFLVVQLNCPLHNWSFAYHIMEVTVAMLIITSCQLATSTKITTYFLNSDFSYQSLLSTKSPTIDCVYTNINISPPVPSQMTVCYRSHPMLYVNPQSPFSTMISIGNFKSDPPMFQNGFLRRCEIR